MKYFKGFDILAVILALIVPVVASAQGLGGAVGFNRTFVRMNGETTDLQAAVPGIMFTVPMNAVKEEDGTVIDPGTWGLSFATTVLQDSDKGVTLSNVVADFWKNWRATKIIGGVKMGFSDESTLFPERTNFVGVNAALRFNVGAVPAEFGGSWMTSYDGVDNADVSGIYLGLVSDIWGSGTVVDKSQ